MLICLIINVKLALANHNLAISIELLFPYILFHIFLHAEKNFSLQYSSTGSIGMNIKTIKHAKQKPKLKRALEPSLPMFQNSAPITNPRKMCSTIFMYI